jgi:transposase-like protein
MTVPSCPRCGSDGCKSGKRDLADGWRVQEFRCKHCRYEYTGQWLDRHFPLAEYEHRIRTLRAEGWLHKQIMHKLALKRTTYYRMVQEMKEAC